MSTTTRLHEQALAAVCDEIKVLNEDLAISTETEEKKTSAKTGTTEQTIQYFEIQSMTNQQTLLAKLAKIDDDLQRGIERLQIQADYQRDKLRSAADAYEKFLASKMAQKTSALNLITSTSKSQRTISIEKKLKAKEQERVELYQLVQLCHRQEVTKNLPPVYQRPRSQAEWDAMPEGPSFPGESELAALRAAAIAEDKASKRDDSPYGPTETAYRSYA